MDHIKKILLMKSTGAKTNASTKFGFYKKPPGESPLTVKAEDSNSPGSNIEVIGKRMHSEIVQDS